MINNIFIICNGNPLFIQNFGEDKEIHTLLSGFLTAFQMLATNIDQSSISKVELETKTFYYAVRNPIIAVVEAKNEDDIDDRIFQIFAERIARQFVFHFGLDKINSWCGDIDEFKEFKSITKSVLNELNQLKGQNQREFISKYFIEAARNEKILGAVVFDLEKDEILASDIPSDFETADFESFGSMLFSFLDRLAKELKAGGINELMIKAKNYWIGGFRKDNLAVFMIFTMDYLGKIVPDLVKNFIRD